MHKGDIERLNLIGYSKETQDRMIKEDCIMRAHVYPMWLKINARYAAAMEVDMDTYVTIMGNAQDALPDFLFGIYSGRLAELYERMRGHHTHFIIKRLQLKDEGIIK